MSVKLRELIRAIRACKTAAEERAVVSKECALCRTAFASNDEKSAKNRHRNVAKMLYIHMLGYPTQFAQMEALKLIVSNSFSEKRIGYLGLMLLLDEKQSVLMLVTNSLKQDFTNPNPFIGGLALASVGNICSADMARDLAPEVEKFFQHNNPYLRKKATLTAIRCIRKVPELIEDFVGGVVSLLSDKNHSVQLSAVALMIEMVQLDSTVLEQFKKMTRSIVRMLKQIRSHVSEYDIGGVPDPFLQCKLIRFLRLLGEGDADASEYMNDVLAEVAISTEAAKNPGYAVLYETVMTVMSIEAEGGLRVVAINILGRFLLNRDNNIRYVALNTLCKVVERDTQAIQRHRNLIVDCLKDADISIRRRALDLIYALVTRTNVTALVKELLNYLALTSGDKEFKADLTEKIWHVVERYAPDVVWHIDTITHVLLTAGKYARPHVITDLITLISNVPDFYAYSVHKIFTAARKFKHNQINITQVALWVIGEYGELLVSEEGAAEANSKRSTETKEGEAATNFTAISQSKVLEFIDRVCKHPSVTTTLREYALNTLVKLSNRFDETRPKIQRMIAAFGSSMELELQQRAIEYGVLASEEHAKLRGVMLARMPKLESKRRKESADKKADDSGSSSSSGSGSGSDTDSSDSDSDGDDEQTTSQPAQQPAPSTGGAAANLFAPTEPTAQPTPQPANDLLGDLFGTTPQPQPQPQAQAQPQPQPVQDDLSALFGMGSTPQPVPQPAAPQFPTVVGHDSKVLSVAFSFTKDATSVTTTATFTNKTGAALSDFEFQVAVPRYITLQLRPAPANTIAPGGQLTQSFQLTNQNPAKKLMIRMRINYAVNGQAQVEQGQFGGFP